MLSTKTLKITLTISGFLLVIGAVAHLFASYLGVYSFGLGAIGLTFIKLKHNTNDTDFRIKRLRNIQALAAVLLLGTAYLMYIQHDFWVIALLLSASMDLIVSFRMPKNTP